MNGKSLFAIILCGVIIAVAFLSISQIRYDQGYNKGLVTGHTQSTGLGSQAAWMQGNHTGYEQGFQAGLKQAGGISSNSTG